MSPRRPIILLIFLCSCAPTYYHATYNFNSEFERGDLKNALEALQENPKQAEGKARFIYYLNNGLLLSILGRYEESNNYFEQAFLFGEDYHMNYLTEAASYMVNPQLTIYRGEDHEHLLLLYFKAINFLKMNRPEQALVECRRLNNRLNTLSDRYVSEKKFQRDAFVHTLMGIIYQSTQDYNNAFIAYRNAVDIYETDYAEMFNMRIPQQLKKDLLNTAWWTGFVDEFEHFKTKFNMEGYKAVKHEAELVFFWNNGLSPVKGEWGIDFLIDRSGEEAVVFSNPAMGVRFPFEVKDKKEQSDLTSLEIFRVAFPKYVERPLYYRTATIQADTNSFELEQAENVSKIAFYSLEQRMMTEFSKGLLRAATKKITEHSIRKEDERLGALIGMVNAMTEKADTRNWQTLPHSIYYSRVPLKEGENKLRFMLKGPEGNAEYNFTYRPVHGQTLFHTFSSLETSVRAYRLAGD
jgi:uncharacterized protein